MIRLARHESIAEIADEVAIVRQSIVNAYLIGPSGARDRQWILVDAGLPLSEECFRRAALERFGPDSRPAAIILTHGHFDHVGALPQLAEEWQADVYCHALEMPYLTGQSAYPPPDPTVGGLMGFMSRFFPRGPIDLTGRIRVLPPDGTVPGMTGWNWIATPGHSPGHVSLMRNADRTLIAGDAFVAVAQESALSVALDDPAVHRPPPYYTPDWSRARESVETLQRLQPRLAATGHGPILEGRRLERGLQQLVENWDKLAVPPGGRYSRQSAKTNEYGTQWTPPAVSDARLQSVVIGGLLLAGIYLQHQTRITRDDDADV